MNPRFADPEEMQQPEKVVSGSGEIFYNHFW